jgi:regulator of sirC expression with transglutaminase-like and TPR domain
MATVRTRSIMRLLLWASVMACFMALSSDVWAQTADALLLPDDPNVRILEQLANPSDGRVDYAKVEVAIEHMVNPSFDDAAFEAELNHWANIVRAHIPEGAPPTQVMTALGEVIYTSGPWNDHHPFSYDLADQSGLNVQTKLISNYLRTRKGNCVSMSTLLVILGQKLGLDMTLTQAPQHEFVRLRDINGRWINIEATSPGSSPDDTYIRDLHISSLAIRSGIYLRTTTPRETVAAMISPLESVYAHTRPPAYLLGLAELAERLDPKNADGIVFEADAYFLELGHRYLVHHLTPNRLPPTQRLDFNALYNANVRLINQAEAMGWTPPTGSGNEEDLQRVQNKPDTAANRSGAK